MSDTNLNSTIKNSIVSALIDGLQTNQNRNFISSQSKLDNLPTMVDSTTLKELKNGDFGITLKDYTNLNTYRNTMSALYGNSSSDKFANYLNSLYGNDNDNNTNQVSAKTFLEKMREKGISNKSALKIYSSIQKYSAIDTKNNSFVSAKI